MQGKKFSLKDAQIFTSCNDIIAGSPSALKHLVGDQQGNRHSKNHRTESYVPSSEGAHANKQTKICGLSLDK